ncbi:methyltransferase domain-containing protein [Achromobacter aegrifaciens]|uniref:Methyltransferase domain-containing protein n=1 Tax=Achromobacter aegrifaciens TaxID=1287736 RepID=A0ABU2DD80_ACHAE|nr:methyltransferase domain-containing protein [Achromobacter aegrifaciens]MDR7946051.1 methyltransferase domain-containing protein [Achromobacter aegrifaciens]
MCNAWCMDWGKEALPHVKKGARVLEVGSRDVNGTLRTIFADPQSEYVGIDIFEGPGVDLVLDASRIVGQFGTEAFDVVLSTEMLEHCYDWQGALYQMAATLREGGILVLTTRSPGFELHDYPADHWRFSHQDFVDIFSPLGELIAVGDDMTLGWPCGVGVIVRRTCSAEELQAWVKRLREFPVYSMEEEARSQEVETRSSTGSPTTDSMVFDQYSRYQGCVRILRDAGLQPGATVLDVGSGPECLLGSFLGEATITYVDPLLAGKDGPHRISGDVFTQRLDDCKFDYVCAVDVLEHVPAQHREAFLDRLTELADKAVLVGFPPEEGGYARETDDMVNSEYERIHGSVYSWLAEHYHYGLPVAASVNDHFARNGFPTTSVGHGHVPWLKRLLSKVICYWDVQPLKPEVLDVSKSFNEDLAPYDFAPPHYRIFVLASKSGTPIKLPDYQPSPELQAVLDSRFESLASALDDLILKRAVGLLKHQEQELASAKADAHTASLWGVRATEEIKTRDDEIRRLQSELSRMTEWGGEVNEEIKSRDDEIRRLQSDVGRLNEWEGGVQDEIRNRDDEIRRLQSDISRVTQWGGEVNEGVRSRDDEIRRLQTEVGRMSEWGEEVKEGFRSRDDEIRRLQSEVGRMSEWGGGMNEEIKIRDDEIRRLQSDVNRMTEWGKSLDIQLAQRDAALEKARAEMEDYTRVNQRGSVRMGVRLIKAAARRHLAASPVGDVVRSVRSYKARRQSRTNVDAITQSLKRNNGRLLLVFPIITWDFRWQRPQHFVTRLRDNGYSACYLAMSMTPLGRKFASPAEAAATLSLNELDKDVAQVWLHTKDPINIYTDTLAGDDLDNVVAGLSELIRDTKPKSIHYLLQFPGWWPVAQQLKEKFGGKIVFDCMDDHAGFSTNTAQALKVEQALIEAADLVIASSALLEDRCHLLNPRTVQIKNGTEFKHFAQPVRNGLLEAYSDKPIVGYYGAISDWFDTELIAHCARAKPDWNFVLIGATAGADLNPLQGLPNVHLCGEKSYVDLPGYLAYFDVCTIPFKLVPLTLATNPVKFYEYMSAGKPVVSIDLPELAAYADDCYLAHNAREFIEQLEKAMEQRQDEEKIRRRIELAKENSWDARVKSLLKTAAFSKP